MSDPRPPLSRREREIMELVYRLGGATAAQVAAGIPDPPSYSAVRSMLSILETKGHLRHELRDHRYLYLPSVPRGRARRQALQELVRTFFDGSAKEAAAALIDGNGRELSREDLAELRERIDLAMKQGR
jgi:predicted transcriptional regulator